MSLMKFIFFLISVPPIVFCVFDSYPKIENHPVNDQQAGVPLILTPLIESGKIEEAQNTCKNRPFKGDIISYSGYLTVNKYYNSEMFFWFFPAIENSETAPVVLWLQGGPGATSLFGVFNENGPFSVQNRHGLKLRKHTWITSHSMIYIDNPIGTGFSFTDEGGLSENEEDISANLYSALTQFFTLFPKYQRNEFFIAGESYAGKYIPALAYKIDNKNPTAKLKINLKGLAIGNGLCDPEHMLSYGDYFYQIGLLDSNGRDLFHNKEQSILSKIQQRKWIDALSEFNSLMNGDGAKTSIVRNLSGFYFYFNYLYSKNYLIHTNIGRYISISDVRKNLHVGNAPFTNDTKKVESKLVNEFMQSVASRVEYLLERYRVLLYSGQLDMLVPFPMTESFVDALHWSGTRDYRRASRKLWYVGEELAGYSKVARKLTVLLVRNAGHMVPMDQPEWAVDLITKFTRNIPF